MKPSKEEAVQILKAGNAQQGIRLFALLHGAKHPFLTIANKCHSVLFDALAQHFNIKYSPKRAAVPTPLLHKEGLGVVKKNRSIREDYPFLAEESCPKELKALVGDKITAYNTYREWHPKLFDVTNNQQGFETVKKVVEAYIENRAIHFELQYYKKHKVVLGKHPIFNELNELQEIRKLSAIELPSKQKQLEHNIWRVKNELAKKGQDHLRVEREKRRAKKERQLAEVKRLIALAKKK